MVVESAHCLRCGKEFYPRIGEEFCSPVHAREYFGVVSPDAPSLANLANSVSNSFRPQDRTALTGRHRVMSLLKLAPVQEPEALPPPLVDAVLRYDLSTCLRTPVKVATRFNAGDSYATVAAGGSTIQTLSISSVASCTTEPELRVASEPFPFQRPGLARLSAANIANLALEPVANLAPECFGTLDLLPAGAGELPAATSLFALAGMEAISWRAPLGVPLMKTDAVASCAVPARPLNPRWSGDLRKFDWAQLIARLADFDTEAAANPQLSEKAKAAQAFASSVTAKHKTPRIVQEPLAHRIPVLGPAFAFWNSQSWLVRALVFAIPLLALVALKPSFDGSLEEPVVLAKTMPPASSTVLRRMPSREQAAERGAKPYNKPAPSSGTAAAAATPAAENGADSAPPIVKPDLPIATVEPRLTNMDRMLLARAAVELVDDFSFGLDSWDSNSANSLTWSYDQTGFIRPRGLALFRPSMSLTNYTVEFLAKIDASAVGWAIRAMDHNNYHAVKIIQRGGGPLPRYTIVRYTVVDGREGPRIEHPLPLNLYKDTLFRIRMDIRGSNYSLLVQDSVVDSWSDNRFEFGGMGFFSGRGEESRIRWVQVTYQNDLLGKICAWLAPKTS